MGACKSSPKQRTHSTDFKEINGLNNINSPEDR
jgi:hypothetical protein